MLIKDPSKRASIGSLLVLPVLQETLKRYTGTTYHTNKNLIIRTSAGSVCLSVIGTTLFIYCYSRSEVRRSYATVIWKYVYLSVNITNSKIKENIESTVDINRISRTFEREKHYCNNYLIFSLTGSQRGLAPASKSIPTKFNSHMSFIKKN